jgi:hypothetical protein
MSGRVLICIAFAVVTVFLAGCYKPTQRVIQGKLVAYDAQKKVLMIDDELTQESDKVPVYLGDLPAQGLPPIGGIVRVSYNEREGKNMALRFVDLDRAMKLFKLKKQSKG